MEIQHNLYYTSLSILCSDSISICSCRSRRMPRANLLLHRAGLTPVCRVQCVALEILCLSDATASDLSMVLQLDICNPDRQVCSELVWNDGSSYRSLEDSDRENIESVLAVRQPCFVSLGPLKRKASPTKFLLRLNFCALLS